MGTRRNQGQHHLTRIHAYGSVSALDLRVGYRTNQLCSTKKILDDNPELAQKWTSLIPQGKMGRPEDLMGAVTYLLSDAAGYVTGKQYKFGTLSTHKD